MSVPQETTPHARNSSLLSAAMLVAGMVSLHLFRHMPPTPILLAASLLVALLFGFPRWRSLALLPAGFILISMGAREAVEQKLDPQLVGVDIEVDVRISDFPERRGDLQRMLAEPLQEPNLPVRLRLSWLNAAESPQLGECWRLTVRLRRPRGFANPGGFDYEGWLIQRRIGATGYVRSGQAIDDCPDEIGPRQWRRYLARRLLNLLPDDDAAAVMLAITVGARQNISASQWELYATTGTSHLMAISGMHIGLAAGATYVCVWLLLSACRWHGNHRVTAAILALLAAAVYASLSGFAVPARRALTMLSLVTVAVAGRRRVPPWHFFALAVFLVAATAPLDVLSPGFQLSFAAVAILLLVALRRPLPASTRFAGRLFGAIRSLAVLQIALLIGLLPLTAALFARATWIAPGVNLLVLPVFNLVSVPAALLGLALDGPFAPLGDCLLRLAWSSISAVLWIVEHAAALPGASRPLPTFGPLRMLLACLLLLWVLLPPGWPGRRIAWVALAATLLHSPPRPPAGCVDIHTLDVGQGLAVVTVTRRHVLVFDTGPAFRSGTDAARIVLTPFLRSLGIDDIDLLVVSHSDLDHAGGVTSLQEDWKIHALLTGEPVAATRNSAIPCNAGQIWSWDGIVFRVLHPTYTGAEGNNASCVVEIDSGGARALLTGDIESRVERHLLRQGYLSPTALVVMPHHGSATSSGEAFVQSLSPDAAVASAGFANRWGMPRDEVVERWRRAGASIFTTAADGAVSFRLCSDTGMELLNRARHEQQKVWHE